MISNPVMGDVIRRTRLAAAEGDPPKRPYIKPGGWT
jgi:hypothetical protein